VSLVAIMSSTDDNRRAQLLACYISLFLLTTIAVCLRVIARRMSMAQFALDDAFIILALVSFWGLCTCAFFCYKFGLGLHISSGLSLHDQLQFDKSIWAVELLYQPTVCLYKFSIIFCYCRIFGINKNRLPMYLVGGLTGVYSIWSILQTLLQCLPIAAGWRVRYPHPGDRCISGRIYFLSLAIPNVILDWALLLLPLPFVFTLRMSNIRKFEVSLLFILGGMVCIFSIVRLFITLSTAQTDITWNYVPLAEWSAAETSMGIICPCLITLRPLLRLFGKSYDSTHHMTATTATATGGCAPDDGGSRGPFIRMNHSVTDEVSKSEQIKQKYQWAGSNEIALNDLNIQENVDTV